MTHKNLIRALEQWFAVAGFMVLFKLSLMEAGDFWHFLETWWARL
jgi:hypothetical protein